MHMHHDKYSAVTAAAREESPMTNIDEHSTSADGDPRLGFWLRAAGRGVRTRFAQAAWAGAEHPTEVADEIDRRIAAAVAPEDAAAAAAALEAIAREFGFDDADAREEGPGFGLRGFGPGWFGAGGPFGRRGFGPRGFGRHRHGHGHGHGQERGEHGCDYGHHGHHDGHGRRGRGFAPAAADQDAFERGFDAGYRAAERD